MKKMNPDSVVACRHLVRALEFWQTVSHRLLDEKRELDLQNGYPQVYYHFLDRCCPQKSLLAHHPALTQSELAYSFMIEAQVSFILIHVDTSHSYDEAMRDMRLYWRLYARGDYF